MLVRAPLNFGITGTHLHPCDLHPFFFCSSGDPNFCSGSGGGGCSTRMRTTPWRLAVVRAGYTRIPMETAGAYQLVDEVTGEKVIVWGGANDNGPESPPPSKEALSWKPPAIRPSASRGDNKSSSRLAGISGSFGRLKAQRVRAVMKRKMLLPSRFEKGNPAEDDDDVGTDSEVEFERNEPDRDDDEVGESRFLRSISREEAKPAGRVNGSVPREGRGGGGGSFSAGWGNTGSSYSGESTSSDLVVRPKQRKKGSGDDGGFFSRKSFREVGCSDDMVESLSKQLFRRPSHIQAMAYAPVSEGKSCIIADQSGSGKTLAYLAPTIQRLRQEELLGLGKSSSRSPRVVILVPTAELASQVLNNCRSMAKSGVPFRSMVATGGFRQKTQLDSLQQDLDVLIATPGRFIYLFQEGFVQLTNLKCAILDEVDILFGDEGFEQVLQSLIGSAPVSTQYLFVTATLPVVIYNKLVEAFPDCEVVMGPGVHRTSSRLEEVLVDCSGEDGQEKTPESAFLNKKSALLRLVEESPVPKTIVFCNKIETCRKVENMLKRIDRKELHIKVLPFHAALDQEVRLSNMKEFLNSKSSDSLFLICTDRASRGIDFANVEHVVLFDFPRDPSEYVRRVGRTARGAGGAGKAFVLVVGKQVSLARRILERNKKGHPLHDVPSAYELENSSLL